MIEIKSKQDNPVSGGKVSKETVDTLVADLGSQNGLERVRARKSLISIGGQAVEALSESLTSKKRWVRWEAAKTLGQIGNAKAAAALITALEDKLFDVRWLAAEGLITIGPEALAPLLTALKKHPESRWLQEGVHHVLHDIDGRDLKGILHPVIIALEGFEPSVEVPLAIELVLKAMKKDIT